jgi:uncharacterized protein (TIGR02996 family)
MSEEAAFLAAITANPEDDTARLVYADWLQERNDPRAVYLRLEVRRHRMRPRERRQNDPFHQLEGLRKHATPDWLSRIDRTMRLSMFWPQNEYWLVERTGLAGKPLACIRSRGNHNTRFPKATTAGDYLYVFAMRNRELLIVARMRFGRFAQVPYGDWGPVEGAEGTEGTRIRFDLPVTGLALSRLSWYSGKEERRPNLHRDPSEVEERLTSSASVSGILRLTPRTAADLDAILRGESLS